LPAGPHFHHRLDDADELSLVAASGSCEERPKGTSGLLGRVGVEEQLAGLRFEKGKR
jgi:hypothetical protein